MRPIPIAQYLNQFGKVEPARGERLQRDSVLLKSRILSTPADIDGRIAEAYQRGKHEGLVEGRGECEAALAEQRSHLDEFDAAERLAWQANEYAQFAEKIDSALATMEERVASGVARILKPFLIEERVKQVTQALSENLSKILSADAPAALKITGPEALLSVLKDRLAAHPVAVEYVEGAGVDVTVEAHQTIIKSQLQAWIDHLDSIDG